MYKTIALELLKARPQFYRQLCQEQKALETMEACAVRLKQDHGAYRERLSKARPGSDPQQIASEAMELAIRDLEACLPPATPSDASEAFSLDEAMAFLRRDTPPA